MVSDIQWRSTKSNWTNDVEEIDPKNVFENCPFKLQPDANELTVSSWEPRGFWSHTSRCQRGLQGEVE